MSDTVKSNPRPDSKPDSKAAQQERLNAALRANLNKRKQQARKRNQALKNDPDAEPRS